MRYFENPYDDYKGGEAAIDKDKIFQLIEKYVNQILHNKNYKDGDVWLYIGTSGLAYMFLKLHQSEASKVFPDSLQHARVYIEHAKKYISRKEQDKASFLCGNAGIYAVSSIINYEMKNFCGFNDDKKQFLAGSQICKRIVYNSYGSDEILFGRAGYLSGIYWINQNAQNPEGINDIITEICNIMIESGYDYSNRNELSFPLMYECYGDRYLGAAHGICAILHMLLESPLFDGSLEQLDNTQKSIKTCVDMYLETQSQDGNFPCVIEDAGKDEHTLVHWCHGGPGSIYLFGKAYLIFKDEKYLDAAIKIGELVWEKGLLKKGPGICHGVAGNGYVFLILYRLTNDQKYLYRANCFADFLTNEIFVKHARNPDHPLSLYEGVAGAVCYLLDLLEPQKASFPFMDIFERKY
ncbi:unnamed protein product [Chironomus riparius]|uniref:LanC-like protein 3 homolog n=1 Tax=Chironomus riparius TaxID=315576 RepID=A0A9N9RPY4_9DIPT|nr:unnamed protein product [Chironomus riparius]